MPSTARPKRAALAVPPPEPATDTHDLIIEGARQNNLKNVSLRIPHDRVTAITGVSGSGKSSLAFDTLFAEGQWRYVESLSTYARMFLEKVDRPDVDRLRNIRPAIAIEQKNPVRTARSTVGTATELADLFRLLFAKIGTPICPDCGTAARSYTPGTVVDELLTTYPDGRAMIGFPVKDRGPAQDATLIATLLSRGVVRMKCGPDVIDLQPDTRLPATDRTPLWVVHDRLILRADARPRLIEAVETAFAEGEGTCFVDIIGRGLQTYSTAFRCQSCTRTFEPIRPLLFSFNHPLGACPECKGFGNLLKYDPDLVIPDRDQSLADGAIEPWSKPSADWWQQQMLLHLTRLGVDTSRPYRTLPEDIQRLLWEGNGDKFEGIQDFFTYLEGKRYKLHVRVMLSRYRSPSPCPTCDTTRLRKEARYVKIAGQDIAALMDLTVADVDRWIGNVALPPMATQIAKDVLRQVRAKLGFLQRVGLGYLTLSRQTRTLSGGEAQRIALANQLGSKLVGTLYVLDEPTIGLHPRDTATLAGILRELAEQGNTVVVVEHDPHMIQAADHIVEMGPASGEFGGQVVCAAPKAEFLRHPQAITARYLRGEARIDVPATRRSITGKALMVAGACAHNLKHVTAKIPLRTLTCVTGISGSGKSTLVEETIYRALARAFRVASLPIGRFTAIKGVDLLKGVQLIDQEPIGRTPRSNPATYLKLFDSIRALFADTYDAKKQGLKPGHFSFNTDGGRCPRCQGNGYEKLEMYFFEDIYATCEACNGQRFKPNVLAVRLHGKTIHEVLGLTVDEALRFFSGAHHLQEALHVLTSIGLGYLRLGQPATTLSGGEAQRLKIAAELQDRDTKDRLYILDEPTTGLHLDDIKKLVAVLHQLVDAGNTVLVVEHNLDVIKTADWIIDLGPEGGEAGGQIVAEGRPEQVAQIAASQTGRFLKPLLERTREAGR